MSEREDGFYWVQVRIEGADEWVVAELRYGMDWYFTGRERRVKAENILKIDWRRLRRAPAEGDVPVGSVVEMSKERGDGRTRGQVTEVDLSLRHFPYKVWYGPESEDWVRLGPDEFTVVETPPSSKDD